MRIHFTFIVLVIGIFTLLNLQAFADNSKGSSIKLGSNTYTPLDKTVAIVDDTVILESEIDQRIRHVRAKNPDFQITQALRERILDQLILETLQLQVARRYGINISDVEIQSAIEEMTLQLQQNDNSLQDYLELEQRSEREFQHAMRKEITLKKLQDIIMRRRIQVTEREIDAFLESREGQEWLTPRFLLQHILLPTNNSSDESQQLQKALNIIKTLQDNKQSFGALATQHSKGPNANDGGNLGWRTQDQLPNLFYQAVIDLDAGEFTAIPVKSPAGFHLLKVVQRSGAKPVMVTRYQVRHILIKPSELFTDAEAKIKIDDLYQRLEAGVDFAGLAKEFSDDIGSKQAGGILDWTLPGQLVPEFETTMQDTPIGETSRPFRSQFGWHVLRVEDVKQENMFETVKKNQVANLLRERRFEDEMQLWLDELREEAFVEILL